MEFVRYMEFVKAKVLMQKIDKNLIWIMFWKCQMLHCGVKLTGSEVNKIIRLGKPTNDSKSWSLFVSFANYDKKEEIFKKISGLSKVAEKFKRISIMHDMTKAERLADKKLVEQAKELEANDPSENLVARVVGPPWDRKLLNRLKRK